MEDLILNVIGSVLTAAISYASLRFAKLSGIQIEERHQRALHEALMSGATAFINGGSGGGVNEAALAAIAHARQSVPDAMLALNPSRDVLTTIARRKAAEAMSRL